MSYLLRASELDVGNDFRNVKVHGDFTIAFVDFIAPIEEATVLCVEGRRCPLFAAFILVLTDTRPVASHHFD